MPKEKRRKYFVLFNVERREFYSIDQKIVMFKDDEISEVVELSESYNMRVHRITEISVDQLKRLLELSERQRKRNRRDTRKGGK